MLEPVEQQYVMIGHIARSHGVEGTVLIIPEYYAPALFEDIDLVRLQDARGDFIPARIESVRVQEKNNRLSFFVKFDHITDRNEADRLKNFSVYINRNRAGSWLDENQPAGELVSFEVINAEGVQLGLVDEVIDSPGQSILMVQTGEGELLIPLVDEYVLEIDEERKIIHCQNLDQLSNL